MQRVVIAGFGFMGGMHAQAYGGIPEVTLVGIADPDPVRAKAQAEKLGVKAPVFPSLAEALTKAQPDVVDVCVPTDLHAKVALEALAAGKHVFCEKPLAYTAEEAGQIGAAAEKAGVRFMTGHCIRFWPEYQAFEKFLKGGTAGKLLSLTLQRRSALPLHSAGNWLLDPKRSGGAALDLHIHDTDWVLHLLGTPKAVTSRGTIQAHGIGHIYTDYAYPGLVVRAEGGWNYPKQWGFQMAFQAVFEYGAAEYDSGKSPTLRVTLGDGAPEALPYEQPASGESKSGTGNVSSLGGYFNELRYFIDCLEQKRAPANATLAQATETLRVVLAEMKSVSTGQAVTL